jgi:alpha-mannosidase
LGALRFDLVDNRKEERYSLHVVKSKQNSGEEIMAHIETLYLIHHSHTDIGYTHDQPIVLELHERFLSQALKLVERDADRDRDGAFRWTVENTYVLSRWLTHASSTEIERFQALERAGRIEVTAMFANLTPLLDTDELIESLQLVGRLRRDYGFTITSAMNCDVNGENWPLVDLLLDIGIQGFTMAINTHFGGAPFQRPNVFCWQGPSGRTLLAYNGWPYDQGWRFGIGRSFEEFEQVWWPRVLRRLEEVGYPLPVLMVQSFHPFGDNGPAFAGFSDWIDRWNASGKLPRIRMATPREWWTAVQAYADQLPTYRGDWTDYWNFGCASSAREQAINRQSRARLRTADALAAAILPDPWLPQAFLRYRQEAWDQLILWDEHTWGADISISQPDAEDTAAQWYHKAHFAYQARSLSLLLQRDALAALARQIQRTASDEILVFNPLPWERLVSGDLSNWVLSPRGLPEDSTSGRHMQDRQPSPPRLHALLGSAKAQELSMERIALPPTSVPGYGYVVIPRARLITYRLGDHVSEDAIVENAYHRLTFDTERGGVLHWLDKALGHDWVDESSEYRFNSFVHEEVADLTHPWPRHLLFQMLWESKEVERPSGWRPGWRARRRTPINLLRHQVFHTPLGIKVIQVLEAPGIVGPLVQETFLPVHAPWVEFCAYWHMSLSDHPESTYLLYPFRLAGATVRFDLGPQAMQPEVDQLPGTCRDYFTVQNWVDFHNGTMGVIIATPENPMVQLGNFAFGRHQAQFTLPRPLFVGWVTNNYWETNFRAHQPGLVTARYRIQPYAGPFDEGRAHRFGLEALYDQPLAQHLGEPTERTPWPASGSLLRLPQPPVMVLHIKPSSGNEIAVRLLNASDEPQEATVSSSLLRIVGAMVCDLFEGADGKDVAVRDGVVTVEMAPRQVIVLKLRVIHFL